NNRFFRAAERRFLSRGSLFFLSFHDTAIPFSNKEQEKHGNKCYEREPNRTNLPQWYENKRRYDGGEGLPCIPANLENTLRQASPWSCCQVCHTRSFWMKSGGPNSDKKDTHKNGWEIGGES